MEFTGERFLPEVSGGIALEHKHRYLQAALYARDKDVLDIACGEGYGSALLANVAGSVIGVDISPEAVAHAKSKYTAHNLEYRQGSAEAIPLPDASVDLVVSFETIEHHDKHEEMFQEIKRVLRPGGVLCMSSPDHYEYSIAPGYDNEYHVKELTLEEFDSLLARHFANRRMTGQRLAYGSLVAAREGVSEFIAWNAESTLNAHALGLPRAVYLIALASDGELPETFSSLLEATVEDSDPYRFLLEADTELKHKHHALEKEFHTLEDAYRALEKEFLHLGKEYNILEKTHHTLENAHHALENAHHALENAHHALENAYSPLEDEFKMLMETHDALKNASENRIQELEGAVNGMLASRSWRITKPLRMVGALVRRIRSGLKPSNVFGNTFSSKGKTPGPAIPAVKTLCANAIQERVAAYKSGQDAPAVNVQDVRIYVAAAGNCFFQDIACLIQGGFTDIGVQATVVVAESFEDCAHAPHAAADLHIIVAPHELFHFIPQAANWPHGKGKKWILNTEQAHTSWFAGAKASFSGADLILDMDQDLAATLARNGFPAEHLPLGYSPSCRVFDGTAPIELNRDTSGIPSRIRDWMDTGDVLHSPLHARPFDYCFFGASTQRRTEFFARNAATFAKLEGYLRLKPLSGTLRVGESIALSTEGTSSIIRRSKVSLNIHQSDHRYFEWHRIILQGIWQGALVLSEPCTAAWPFRPGIDYVAADLADLADTLEYVTLSGEGRAFAERVRCQAYATLTERCRMGDRLRELLRLYFGVAGEMA